MSGGQYAGGCGNAPSGEPELETKSDATSIIFYPGGDLQDLVLEFGSLEFASLATTPLQP